MNPEGAMYVTCGTSSGCLYHSIEEDEHLVFQGQPETPSAIRIDITDKEAFADVSGGFLDFV